MSIEVERNLDYAFKVTNMFIQGPTAVMDVINELLSYLDKDPAAKLLKDYVKHGGQLDFTICKPEYAKEIAELLKDHGVTFLETQSMANGGVHMFVFPDTDRARVDEALGIFRAEHEKNGVSDRSVFWAYADGNVNKIKNLSLAEATLMAEHAKARGIKIVVEEPHKGTFDISYAMRDIDAMNRIKTETAIELSGLAGQALKKQVEYENDNYLHIMRKACSYQKDQPFYAVDLNGQSLKVDKHGLYFTGKDGIVTVDRIEDNFKERLNDLMQKLRSPVMMNEKQFEGLQNAVDKKNYLVKIDKSNGRPEYTAEEYKAIKEMAAKKELYELKLSMLNPEQQKYDICIENEDMRLATFEEYNDLNEKEVEISKDINPVILEEIQERLHNFREEVVTDVEIDHELEEEILDGRIHEHSQMEDLAFDIMHDKNDNLIPDEYEQ